MSILVLILGSLVSMAGLVALGFSIRINDFSLGHTLILTGTTAFSGGLVAIGLGVVIGKLTRIAKALERGAAASHVAPAADIPAAEARSLEKWSDDPVPRLPDPRPAADVDVSATAIERLRSSLAHSGRHEPVAEDDDFPAATNGALPPSAHNGSGHRLDDTLEDLPRTPAAEKKRLDFLFRSRAKPPAAAEPAGTPQPQRRGNGAYAPRMAEDELAPHAPSRRGVPDAAPPPRQEQAPAAIIKSGVVDGMAYTLYADGSIEAELPQGAVRFGSITELRDHIENNS